MNGNISIVIGSWGSYNECNERTLGSKWLDLSDYEEWDEIVEELKKEGFELDGIDEELFIQDIEGISDRSVNWDYMNPKTYSTRFTNRESLPTITNTKNFALSLKLKTMTILKNWLKIAVRIGTITSIFGVAFLGKITEKKCWTVADITSPNTY